MRGDGGEPAEHARLRAAGVKDVRPFATEQPDQLDEPRGVPPRIDRTANVPQRVKARTRSPGGLVERARSVRRDRHVEIADERREQGRHVRLRPADLGQRDDQEDARSAPSTA
jgi:hypothetical protein